MEISHMKIATYLLMCLMDEQYKVHETFAIYPL